MLDVGCTDARVVTSNGRFCKLPYKRNFLTFLCAILCISYGLLKLILNNFLYEARIYIINTYNV